MTPLTQQVNSQPQASSWATGSGHEHLMCCHTPITNTEPGNECVKERIVIWTHWKRESRLIWHQGVLLPLFCDLDQITSPVPAFPSLCTILHCLSAVSVPALHGLLGWLILPWSLPGFPMSHPKNELGSWTGLAMAPLSWRGVGSPLAVLGIYKPLWRRQKPSLTSRTA